MTTVVKSLVINKATLRILQVIQLLNRLTARDKAMGRPCPVLEDLCLQESWLSVQQISQLNVLYPSILCHASEPGGLDSRTWVDHKNSYLL